MRGGHIVQSAEPQALYSDPVDPEVALFVGEAVLLEAELAAGKAETALGPIPLRGKPPVARRATVMLRPEQISCQRHLDGSARGSVIEAQFFGHDASARIALDKSGGLEIVARVAGHHLPKVGEEVSILVEGSALAFAEGSAPPPSPGRLRRIPPAVVPPAGLLGVSGGPPRG